MKGSKDMKKKKGSKDSKKKIRSNKKIIREAHHPAEDLENLKLYLLLTRIILPLTRLLYQGSTQRVASLF